MTPPPPSPELDLITTMGEFCRTAAVLYSLHERLALDDAPSPAEDYFAAIRRTLAAADELRHAFDRLNEHQYRQQPRPPARRPPRGPQPNQQPPMSAASNKRTRKKKLQRERKRARLAGQSLP